MELLNPLIGDQFVARSVSYTGTALSLMRSL